MKPRYLDERFFVGLQMKTKTLLGEYPTLHHTRSEIGLEIH